ncbi:hypothetical protein R2B70_03390 [Aeromonas sp. XH]|uniref:hypothetical protein n=1 Tax=Aeromonas sp. XH TaxID=3081770 RepID=UPI002966CC1E|nr:hypothetical protein [Aeromonas sp. XH]WOX49048.1 hypothetical protein R2B70_03390 [Aeromonas sp. XH]
MYKGFNLEVNDSSSFLSPTDNYSSILSEQNKSIKTSLEDLYFKDGTIDAVKLQEAWFPSIDGVHVFISHAHTDIEIAERLACWLYNNFKIKSFIDSHVWGHANDLLRKIDNKYAKYPSGTSYDYEIRNQTTSNVHMLLSSALNTMMDKCEALFFINSEKSISKLGLVDRADEDRTLSPWIMSELATSKIIEKKQAISTRKSNLVKAAYDGMESMSESLGINREMPEFKVSHKVSLEHLHNIQEIDLILWALVNSGRKGYDSLTILYNRNAGANFKI